MTDQVIRVGVIGCGQFMSRQHIQTIGRSPGLRLQHLADRDSERLGRVAARYEAVRTSVDWQHLVEDPEVDVVVVGVVPHLHASMARAALRNGKPVYVEKPLAESVEDCLAVQREAARRGIPVAVGFNRRFAPATRLVRQAFDAAGPPVSVSYRISDDDRIRPPEQSWKRSCRLLVEIVHIFDYLAYLFRSEPESVYAREARFNDASLIVGFENGSQATILSSSWGTMEQPKERLEAITDRAAVEMEDFVEVRSFGVRGLPEVTRFSGRPYDGCDNRHVNDFSERGRTALLELRRWYQRAALDAGVLRDSSDTAAWDRFRTLLGDPPPPQINYAPNKGWGEALEEFCQAVSEGRVPENADAADGARAVACARAGRLSIERGGVVKLDSQTWRPQPH